MSPLPRPPDESERAGNRCPGGPLRPGVAVRAGVRPRTAATPSGPPCGELRLRGTGATLIVRARRGTRRFRPSAADPPRLDRPWQCPRHGAPPPSGVFEQATRPRSAQPARRPPTPASPHARPGSRGTGRLDHTRGIAEGSTSSPPSAPTSWNDRSVGPRSSLPPWEPFRARRRNRSTGTPGRAPAWKKKAATWAPPAPLKALDGDPVRLRGRAAHGRRPEAHRNPRPRRGHRVPAALNGGGRGVPLACPEPAPPQAAGPGRRPGGDRGQGPGGPRRPPAPRPPGDESVARRTRPGSAPVSAPCRMGDGVQTAPRDGPLHDGPRRGRGPAPTWQGLVVVSPDLIGFHVTCTTRPPGCRAVGNRAGTDLALVHDVHEDEAANRRAFDHPTARHPPSHRRVTARVPGGAAGERDP